MGYQRLISLGNLSNFYESLMMNREQCNLNHRFDTCQRMTEYCWHVFHVPFCQLSNNLKQTLTLGKKNSGGVDEFVLFSLTKK